MKNSKEKQDRSIEHLENGAIKNTTRKLTKAQAKELAFRLNCSGYGVRIKNPFYNKHNK